jgi:hypothetical protein
MLGTVKLVIQADVQVGHQFRKRRYPNIYAFDFDYFQTENTFTQTEITISSIHYVGLSYIQVGNR